MNRRDWVRSAMVTGLGVGPIGASNVPPSAGGCTCVSLRDAGAAGDGRADDTDALLRAMALATRDGLPVFVPRGRFRITRPLQLRPPLTLVGVGPGSVLAFDSALGRSGSRETLLIGGDEPDTTPNDHVHLADLAIDFGSDGPQGRTDANLASGLSLRSVSGVIERVAVHSAWSIGIVLHACHDLSLVGCRTENTGRDGITGFWHNARVRVLYCTIIRPGDDGVAFNAADVAMGSAPAEDIQIIGNIIRDGRRFGRGIMLAGAARVLVAGNTIDGVPSSGIAVQPNRRTQEPSRDVVIADNLVLAAGNDPALGQPMVGIRLDHCEGADVHGNRIEGPGAQGLFADGCHELRVSGNSISNWSRHAAGAGLDIRQSPSARLILNTLDGPSGPCVLIDTTDALLLAHNVLRGSSPIVLDRGTGEGGVVTGNTFLAAAGSVESVRREGRGHGTLLVANNVLGGGVAHPASSARLRASGNAGGVGVP